MLAFLAGVFETMFSIVWGWGGLVSFNARPLSIVAISLAMLTSGTMLVAGAFAVVVTDRKEVYCQKSSKACKYAKIILLLKENCIVHEHYMTDTNWRGLNHYRPPACLGPTATHFEKSRT